MGYGYGISIAAWTQSTFISVRGTEMQCAVTMAHYPSTGLVTNRIATRQIESVGRIGTPPGSQTGSQKLTINPQRANYPGTKLMIRELGPHWMDVLDDLPHPINTETDDVRPESV